MLIIAAPKTANTSLMKTLGELHQRDSIQKFFPEYEIPEHFSLLATIHGDIRELDDEKTTIFKESTIIHKQHIPPTENNRLRLKGTKIVLLTRPPLDILMAYRRIYLLHGPEKQKALHNIFSESQTEEDWIKIAEDTGLFQQITDFIELWKKEENVLEITYESLINHPKDTINAIESFFELPVTKKNFTLAKERYSRSKFRYFIEKSIKYCKKVAKKILGFFGLYK